MCSRGFQLRTSLQQLHKMRTGDDPLQSAIRDYRELVDIVAGHEFQRIQHLRVRGDDVQLSEWSHGLAHRSAFPMNVGMAPTSRGVMRPTNRPRSSTAKQHWPVLKT